MSEPASPIESPRIPDDAEGRQEFIRAQAGLIRRLYDELGRGRRVQERLVAQLQEWHSEANIRGELLYQEGSLRQRMAEALIEAQDAAEEYHEAWQEAADLAERLTAVERRIVAYHQLWQAELRRPRGR